MNRIEKAFYFTIIVLLFQITRNISTIIYIGILFFSYAWLYINLLIKNKTVKNINGKKIRPIGLLFLLSLIWIPFISLLNMDMSDYFVAFPRYFVTFPFILFCFLYKQYSYKFTKKVIRIFCVFMAISALSLPYQIIFGRIPFFTDSGYREGLERYASLAGSLTSLGTLGVISLAFLLFTGNVLFTKTKKILLVILTILGMFMSLQKAAIANVIICLILYIFFYTKSSLIKRTLTVMGICILVYGIYYFIQGTDYALYIDSIFRYSFSNSDLGVQTDLISRIWDRPSSVIQYHNMNFFDYLSGIGFPALSGTMGLPQLPMAHNNYFDLLFSGGIIHFISYLILLIRIPVKVIIKKIKGVFINNIDISYSIVSVLILINMIIGAGSFYQPIAAVIIFFIIFSYDTVNLRGSLEK